MAQQNPTATSGDVPTTDRAAAFEDLRGRTIPFAGLTRHSTATADELLPETHNWGSSMKWWASNRAEADVNSDEEAGAEVLPDDGLNSLIHDLPRVMEAEAGWEDPLTGDIHRTSKHNALVDPDRLQAMHAGTAGFDPDDVLAYIPTTNYEIIPPATALEPLAEFLRDEGKQNAVFGEICVAESIGGGASMDVFVDGEHVSYPGLDGDREPIVAGLEIEWDFKGSRSFRARGMMMDTQCLNSLRAVTDWEVIKHAGDLSRVDFYEWYADLWSAIDAKVDVLSDMIEAASEQTFDVSELPADFAEGFDSVLEAIYARTGLPQYLARVAARNASSNAVNPFEPTYWTLHRGATFAITHHARGDVRGGGSINNHHRVAKDILMQPTQVAEQVERDYESKQAEGQVDLDGEEATGIAQVNAAFGGVREMKAEYEERAEEIEQLIAQTE